MAAAEDRLQQDTLSRLDGPILVEDEVAQGVGHVAASHRHGGLNNVGMIPDHQGGPRVDGYLRGLLLAVRRAGGVFRTPMRHDDDDIGYLGCRPNVVRQRCQVETSRPWG